MGVFDDLIPQSPAGGSGAFDDLIPASRLSMRKMPEQELTFGERAATWINDAIGGAPEKVAPYARGFVQGAADPMIGLAQLGANMIGQGDGINRAIQEKERQSDALGTSGIARFAGNVASPVNLALGAATPLRASALGMASQGAGLGLIGGAMQPVTEGDFRQGKAEQLTAGALIGAAAGPVLGKIGNAVSDRMAQGAAKKSAEQLGAAPLGGALNNANQIDQDIAASLAKSGMDIRQLPAEILDSLRKQTVEALKRGEVIDVASAARKADFDLLGMSPTLGQITRNPQQYAREKNLSGVEGVGEGLLNRFSEQRATLGGKVAQLSDGALENYQAGTMLGDTLTKVDDFLASHVSGLYKQARNSSGKALDVPLGGLAQDYATVLHNFGDKVPSGVRNNFEALGLLTGKQSKVFSIDDAENLLKVINSNTSNDPAINAALSNLRGSVKNAILSADDQGGVYALPRKAAAERFALQDAVPALKAASRGQLSPDKFISQHIVGAGTDEVKSLAKILRSYDKESFQQARAQLGAFIERAAFGENAAGDKAFAQERFAKALRQIGKEKLSAFFDANEVKQLEAVSRVAAYISSHPANAPVNSSGTGAMLMSMLSKIPAVGGTIGTVGNLASAAKSAAERSSVVKSGMAANVPAERIRGNATRLSDLLGFYGTARP